MNSDNERIKLEGAKAFATGQVSVAGSADQIVPQRLNRGSVIIKNTDATNTVTIGDSTVTTSTGIVLAAGESIAIDTFQAVYGCTASATVVVGYLETYHG